MLPAPSFSRGAIRSGISLVVVQGKLGNFGGRETRGNQSNLLMWFDHLCFRVSEQFFLELVLVLGLVEGEPPEPHHFAGCQNSSPDPCSLQPF